MIKMLLFAIVVVAGVIGILMLINKQQSPAKQNVPVVLHITEVPTANPLLTATPSAAVSFSPTPSPAQEAVQIATTTAVIITGKGNIVLKLFPDVAPKTVANFLTKAKSGFYNGLIFHRVEDWVIQGGDPKGDGTGGNDMATETSDTPFVAGSLGVAGHQAEAGIISNDAQFFITKTNASWLNKQYTNFGQVTSGMDVVNNIAVGDKIVGISIGN